MMKSIFVTSLQVGSVASTDYFNEKGLLLISKDTLISQHHIDSLLKRNNFDLYYSPPAEEEIEHILSQGIKKLDPLDLGASRGRPFTPAAREEPVDSLKTPRFIDIFDLAPGKKGLIQLSKSEIVRLLDENLVRQIDLPLGQPFKEMIKQIPVEKRTDYYKDKIYSTYRYALKETELVLRYLAQNQNVSASRVEKIVRRFIRVFVNDRNILLNIAAIKPAEGDYLFHHSLNVCLLAINIATSYGYSAEQVVEIGMGALVHDIGMLLVPDHIRAKPSRLTAEEWYEIRKHPIMGLHLLQKLQDMPERIPYITYQVHERENATGYPRQHHGQLVHRFAKMVQVADIYEALTSPRPHRLPILPSEGITKLLQMSQKKFIHPEAVTAFLQYISLYPIGCLVELSDHSIAKVVQANEGSLSKPVVSVLTDRNGVPFRKRRIYRLDLSGKYLNTRIVRVLPYDPVLKYKLMDGF